MESPLDSDDSLHLREYEDIDPDGVMVGTLTHLVDSRGRCAA